MSPPIASERLKGSFLQKTADNRPETALKLARGRRTHESALRTTNLRTAWEMAIWWGGRSWVACVKNCKVSPLATYFKIISEGNTTIIHYPLSIIHYKKGEGLAGGRLPPLQEWGGAFTLHLKIQLCGQVAVDMVADGFADEILGNAEMLRQLPDLGAACGDGIV